MTVQAGIEVETDLELLVGEFEEQACEHQQHETFATQHEGPATHYVRGHCPECDYTSAVVAVCERFVKHTRVGLLRCSACKVIVPGVKAVIILAPVNSSTR